MSDATVRLVRRGELSSNTAQTSGGLVRLSAVSTSMTGSAGLWMGIAELPTGHATEVHHHGESETGVLVLDGVTRWWYGPDLTEHVVAERGDFVYVPAGAVHVEENPSATEIARIVVARTSGEAIVVNLPDHPANARFR